MAVIKTIQVHSTGGISAVDKYIENEEKTTLDDENLERELEYDKNEEKTTLKMEDAKRLVTGYKCDPDNAAVDFGYARQRYESMHKKIDYKVKQPVIATHLVMSFPHDDNLDPRLVHQIGIEFVQGLKERGIGDYQAVISTHVNTEHLHNHILLNSFSIDGKRKLSDNMHTVQMMREFCDGLCIKYGIPIIEEKQKRTRSEKMSERVLRTVGKSWKEQMRTDIKAAISTSKSYADFERACESMGYVISRDSDDIPYMIEAEDRKVRFFKLGSDCTYESILGQIARQNGFNIIRIKYQKKDFKRTKVGAFSPDGRQRSELEMLIREIIAFIRDLIRAFIEAGLEKETFVQELKAEADRLQKSLDIAGRYELKNASEVGAKMKETGKELYTARQSKISYDAAVDRLTDMLEKADRKGTLPEIDPMTMRQRHELYEAIQKSGGYRVPRYKDISSTDCDKVLTYLKSVSADPNTIVPCPAVLTPPGKKMNYRPVDLSADDPEVDRALQEAIEHAKAESEKTQTEIERIEKAYKDLTYLHKAVIDAADEKEQIDREEKREQTRERMEHAKEEESHNDERNEKNVKR